MAAGGNYSPNIPALRTMFRVIDSNVIRRFKGLNVYTTIPQVGPDTAIDLLNVICNNSGALCKFRYPVTLATIPNANASSTRIYDFQQANGTRQLMAFYTDVDHKGNLETFDVNNGYAATGPQFTDLLFNGTWDVVTANNIAFAANGKAMYKWTGAKWQQWGIKLVNNSTLPPTPGITGLPIATIVRAGASTTVTVTLKSNAVVGGNYPPEVGSSITIVGSGDPTIDGTWAVVTCNAVGADPVSFTYTSIANTAFNGVIGTVTLFNMHGTFPITGVGRAGGISTLYAGSEYNNLKVGQRIEVLGLASASFNGTQIVTAVTIGSAASGGGGVAATGYCVIQWNSHLQIWSVARVVVQNGGSGYIGAPNVVFTDLTGDWSQLPLATANIVGGAVVSVTLNNSGISNAIEPAPPTVAFTGGQGAGIPANACAVSFAQNLPDVAKTGDAGTFTVGNDDAGQLLWAYALGNSITVHVGPSSLPLQPTNAAVRFAANTIYVVTAGQGLPANVDTQVDTIWWYRTLSGGSQLYLHSQVPCDLATGAGLTLIDTKNDAELTTSIIAQGDLNSAPIIGSNLDAFQGRIFVSGIPSAPQDIIYSGYELILTGRPEESFPPFNRLRLSIGADAIAGHGVIQTGVVAFSKSQKMYMFRGIVEDISTSQPLLFASYLEELPWQVGCFSHQSIARSPYGLIWLASDKTVKVFDGANEPVTVSNSVHWILNQITPGLESQCRGKYLSWLDNNWYVLSVPFAGSAYNNRVLIFDMNPDPAVNCGMFIVSIPASDVAVIEDKNGQRQLCITNGTTISQIPVSVAKSGFTDGSDPATANLLPAYWTSGFFGQEQPQQRKMFRWARLMDDFNGAILNVGVVDDETTTVMNPDVRVAKKFGAKYSINRKGKRSNISIVFPTVDVDANVVELQYHHIPTGDN